MADLKNGESWNRWGAASGYVALILGIAAASFERGSPPASAPVEQSLAYFIKYRSELLVQSLLFALSAGALLWFMGYLRSYLKRAEGESGGLSDVDGRPFLTTLSHELPGRRADLQTTSRREYR